MNDTLQISADYHAPLLTQGGRSVIASAPRVGGGATVVLLGSRTYNEREHKMRPVFEVAIQRHSSLEELERSPIQMVGEPFRNLFYAMKCFDLHVPTGERLIVRGS